MYSLGAHAPDLSRDDIERIHRVWVHAVREVGGGIHHRGVVAAAIDALEDEMRWKRATAIARLRRRIG